MTTVVAGEGATVAIFDRNEAAFCCVPARTCEALLERLDDAELSAIADARKDAPVDTVTVDVF